MQKNPSRNYKIAILPGDGIGPSIMQEAIKVLEVVAKKYNFQLDMREEKVGGSSIDAYGHALSQKTLEVCQECEAILFGSVGGPKWDNLPPEERPERASLLPLRKHFHLFANLRPSKIYPQLRHLSPLKEQISSLGMDIVCVRELTGGIYFAEKNKDEYQAFDTERYSYAEIERITHVAFKVAQTRRKRLHLIDKANVLCSSLLWRECVMDVAKNYEDVKVEFMYVDNAAMQLIKNPSIFDVMLCNNIFGDILSDEIAAISGSLGLLPSASLNDKGFGMYEPAGGSAPDIAEKNIANPLGQILSAALMLRYSLKEEGAAKDIEEAVQRTLQKGIFTKDLHETHYVHTQEMGDFVVRMLKEIH